MKKTLLSLIMGVLVAYKVIALGSQGDNEPSTGRDNPKMEDAVQVTGQ